MVGLPLVHTRMAGTEAGRSFCSGILSCRQAFCSAYMQARTDSPSSAHTILAASQILWLLWRLLCQGASAFSCGLQVTRGVGVLTDMTWTEMKGVYVLLCVHRSDSQGKLKRFSAAKNHKLILFLLSSAHSPHLCS